MDVDSSVQSIVETYHRLLKEDPDLTMPVAAIEALIELLVQSRAVTVYETLDLVKTQSDYLKSRTPYPSLQEQTCSSDT